MINEYALNASGTQMAFASVFQIPTTDSVGSARTQT